MFNTCKLLMEGRRSFPFWTATTCPERGDHGSNFKNCEFVVDTVYLQIHPRWNLEIEGTAFLQITCNTVMHVRISKVDEHTTQSTWELTAHTKRKILDLNVYEQYTC